MFFLILVLLPATRKGELRGIAHRLVHQVGVRFRPIGWICLLLLLLTGLFNLAYRGFLGASLLHGAFWKGPFGRTLGIKLVLVAVVLLLSAFHDFYVGPRASALWKEQPDEPEGIRLRLQAAWIGRLNFLLALIIVALGVALSRGGF